MAWAINGTPDTLSTNGDLLAITDLDAKIFNLFLSHALVNDAFGINTSFTFNGSTGNEYAERQSINGAADATFVNRNSILTSSGTTSQDDFTVMFAISISGEEKLVITQSMGRGVAGAGNVPNRIITMSKYVPSPITTTITQIDCDNQGSSDYAIDSNLSALGTDLNVVPAITSMYESFQALTSIQVSHFVEWFSGDDIDSIWTKTDISGSGTFAMVDAVDEGFSVTADVGAPNRSSLNFNDKRHYDETECIMISIGRRVSTAAGFGYIGLFGQTGSPSPDAAYLIENTVNTFKQLGTFGATSSSQTNTTVAIDTNFHVHKIECGSADIKLTIDGVLEVTKTTDRPTVRLQPLMFVQSDASPATEFRIRYVEVFNTSITILSSLYERLSALTQIMGQRVVETFTGALLNERWTEEDVTSTGTFAMDDGIDLGFKITTGAADGALSTIHFNNKRQYDPADSTIIFVCRINETTNFSMQTGLCSDVLNPTLLENASFAPGSPTNFRLRTGDASTSSLTTGSVAKDTAFHTLKIECGSANIKLTIDGVLDITKTTNRPTVKLQPYAFTNASGSAAARSMNIRYLEAYNKLTTETDFPSVYELFNPLTTIARQHFWEWFDGNDLSNRWTTESFGGGTPAFAMADGLDLGFLVSTGNADGALSSIHFNNKRQYDETACIIIGVSRNNATAFFNYQVGLANDVAQPTDLDQVALHLDFSNGFFRLKTGDASSSSFTATSISKDTSFHGWKIECGSANIKLTLDGVLEVTKTTNRPTARLQPYGNISASGGAGVRTYNIRYVEAFNT